MKKVLSCIALAIGVSACASEREDPLAGTWRTPGGELTVHFAEDGSFETTAPGGKMSGRYSRAGDERLRMEFDGLSELFAVSVSGDQLVLCQENVRCDRFQRAVP
jgi:hypothetical protein